MTFIQKKTDRALMKQTNQHMVLQLIQGRGPISRKDIVGITGLSPATVSGMTGELIDYGLVREVGEAKSDGRGGRRAVLLRLNPSAGFVVGIKLTWPAITCVLTDLDANPTHTIEMSVPIADVAKPDKWSVAPERMIEAMIQAVEKLLAIAKVDRSLVFGIGIGINGIVDIDTGVSRLAPQFGWRDVPIAAPLSKHFGIPVLLENDARTLTIAEQWVGAGRNVDHFVTIAAGMGIGAGIVMNGQVYRGELGGAGEFGHIVFQADGPLCSCGKRGCLETFAAEPAVLRQIQEALATGEVSVLANKQPLTLEAVTAAADAGDALARRVLAEAGRWLGVGIASLVNILNPQLLIINGEMARCGRWYLDPMAAALRTHALNILSDKLRIQVEPGGFELWARGAACVVLGALFTSPMLQNKSQLVRAVAKV